MERYVHIASNAMRLQAENQRLIASSLANQNTTAFKRDVGAAASIYFDGEDGRDRVFPSRAESSVDLDMGKIIPTDNPLDVAVEGGGFILARKDSGDPVLTRRGDLRVGADRLLRNGENVLIQGDAGSITVPPYQQIEAAHDGTVLIRPPGADPSSAPVAVGRIMLVSAPASNVEKGADGLLRTKDRSVPTADANVQLSPKGLEASNVNSIDAMVDMLTASRSFELGVKLLATARELDGETAKLMRTGN